MVRLEEYIPSPGIKVVIVGDGAVGKSCLLHRYCKDCFDASYLPTIFDNMVAHVDYQGEQVSMNLWDTAGQEDYDDLRTLSYQETHVFLLAYDVTNQTSFKNITQKWHNEVMSYSPQANCVLIGTKSDLRDDVVYMRKQKEKGQSCVSPEAARKVAEDLHCYACIETSSKTRRNVDDAFVLALDSCYKEDVIGGCCTVM